MNRPATFLLVLSLGACSTQEQSTAPDRPLARAGGPYVTTSGSVTFDGRGSADPDGDSLTYAWVFGDATTGAGVAPSHLYTAPGRYLTYLVVTDAQGFTSLPDSTTVSVEPPPPPPEDSVVFTGAGNVASCGSTGDEQTAAILDTLPGFVFTAGDNAFNSGTAEEYANCYDPTWGRFKDRTYPVPGNHEYVTGTADAYFDYFGARAGSRGKGYYSVDLGDWHVIVLNDNEAYVPFAAGSEQEAWLRADLAADTRACTIALWHVPLFLSSTTPGYFTNPTHKILWDDLYAANVDLIVNGHQHWYERMAPMSPDGALDSTRGIRQFNVGTGGASVTLPTVIHPNSEARSDAVGVLKLILKPTSYRWEFIAVPGQTFTDAGAGTCH